MAAFEQLKREKRKQEVDVDGWTVFYVLRGVQASNKGDAYVHSPEGEKLRCMMSHTHDQGSGRIVGFVGDNPRDLKLALLADADFACGKSDYRSTSGVLLALFWPPPFFELPCLITDILAVFSVYR